MSGQLPIDRRRANEVAPEIQEEHKQTAHELAAKQRAQASVDRLDHARAATEVARQHGDHEQRSVENDNDQEEVDDRG